MATIPAVSFENELAYDIMVYDSFSVDTDTDTDDSAEHNYFGKLTPLAKVAAKSTVSIQPIRSSSAFIVDKAAGNKPIKRVTKMAFEKVTAFNVSQADEDAMTSTFAFIDLFLNHPDDALAKQFKNILNGEPSALLNDMNAFFVKQPAYSKCTFQTYMMAITYTAITPATVNAPAPVATYSLSRLVVLMGGIWPPGFPDITVSNFTCTIKDEMVDIWVNLNTDVKLLPFETPGIAKHIGSLYFDVKARANLQFNYAVGLNIFGTRLTIVPDSIKIPTSTNYNTLAFMKPSITIDICPLFKFAVLTVKGSIPFSILGKKFNAGVSMTVDNLEAHLGLVIDGDSDSLPAPPLMKGVHFDEFGVGMGVFFDPPGYTLGLQGKFHIGDAGNRNLLLDDDTFVLVCRMDGDVPEPLYISFYVPKMDINEAVKIFTNASPHINVPVSFSGLSVRWAENPMEPVVLPDGSLSDMGYGFSADIDIFSFRFYGDVEIDADNGLKADVETSPLKFGSLFSLTGDGKGVTIKVDANGNPVKNNLIRNTKALQDALKAAKDLQIVNAGGPVLQINTFTLPFLHVKAKVSLFEIANYGIEADITNNVIRFDVDFGGILTKKMSCALSDFHNFYGEFQYGLNRNFNLPVIAGVQLGTITVSALVDAHISIQSSTSKVIFTIGGGFDFEGCTRRFDDFSADINISKMSGVLEAIYDNVKGYAAQVFDDIVHDAEKWAGPLKRGLITMADDVGTVLKTAYHKQANEIATIMKSVGYPPEEVAAQIKNAFNLGVDAVESAMQSAGYTANEVIDALKNVFSINDIASALKNVYGLSINDINSFLQSAGYTADQVKDAFNSLGGEFASFAKQTWDKIKDPDTWNPSKW